MMMNDDDNDDVSINRDLVLAPRSLSAFPISSNHIHPLSMKMMMMIKMMMIAIMNIMEFQRRKKK